MKVIVLAGGLSPERDVSLSSASLIANALIENGHEVLLLDLLIGSEVSFEQLKFQTKYTQERYEFSVPAIEPDLVELKKIYPNEIGKNVIDICKKSSCVFIALHGSVGENGQLQALFDLNKITYTGTSYIGCLLAMDKDISKKIALFENINTAKWQLFTFTANNIQEISQKVQLPCVIKPLSCGSSVGISIVEQQTELDKALNEARKYEQKIIIEDKINGREFSCGVLNGKALPVIEVKPKSGFYSYLNKYQKGLAVETCPADIDIIKTNKIQQYAEKMHEALRLGYYSRSDFIMDNNGEVFYLESNTLPGMTPTSLLPQEANAIGITYNELCEKILNNSIKAET